MKLDKDKKIDIKEILKDLESYRPGGKNGIGEKESEKKTTQL